MAPGCACGERGKWQTEVTLRARCCPACIHVEWAVHNFSFSPSPTLCSYGSSGSADSSAEQGLLFGPGGRRLLAPCIFA